MQVYLAVPGQVLASAPLTALLAEQSQQGGDGAASSTTAAAFANRSSASSRKGRKGKQQLFYKGIDMMVLRRYVKNVIASEKRDRAVTECFTYPSSSCIQRCYCLVS